MPDLPKPVPLIQLFQNTLAEGPPSGWLYLPEDYTTWSEQTPAYILDDDYFDEIDDDDEHEEEMERRGLTEVVEGPILEDILNAARRDLKADSFEHLLQALTYYFRFDAFLPALDALDPS
ncbi:MAG: hypothetical protein H6817_00710 [Phycisphaerales bacterium]|nr:hypothetical protein [Phycisphaerales bacterium]